MSSEQEAEARPSPPILLLDDGPALGWGADDDHKDRRKRLREDPRHRVALTCQCGCHDSEHEPRVAAWVRAARRYCNELHCADVRLGLARLVGEEFGPPHLASLLVGQMQMCLVCGAHLRPHPPPDPDGAVHLFAEGDHIAVERFLGDHTHSFANCFVVHRHCRPEARACVDALGPDLLDLLARNLADERFRALSVNTNNVLAGHYDPAAIEQLIL